MVIKIGVGEYVGDVTQQAKIQTDRTSGGVLANGWNITVAWFLIFFFFCDHNFRSLPETKPENQFLRGLIHKMSLPRYWFHRSIKLQDNSDFLDFYPQTPQTGRE